MRRKKEKMWDFGSQLLMSTKMFNVLSRGKLHLTKSSEPTICRYLWQVPTTINMTLGFSRIRTHG